MKRMPFSAAGRIPRPAAVLGVLSLTWTLGVCAAEFTESFASDPFARGWQTAGNAALFQWNPGQGALEVTWDSAQTNSFFYLPLGTVLSKEDSFRWSCLLRMRDVRAGTTPGKEAEFPIAIGLLHTQMITNNRAYRGAGVNATYGVRNIVEWNFFPDAGFGDTWAATVVSSNNVYAYSHTFPVPLVAADAYRITLEYAATNQTLHTFVWRNGQPAFALEPIGLAAIPDFRVDAISITSYSDAVQAGLPLYHGSVLAHAFVDEMTWHLPPPPVNSLTLQGTAGYREISFTGASNWLHRLERTFNFNHWESVGNALTGNPPQGRFVVRDTNGPATAAFYRIRSERP
jgi:hypothetical protein